MPNEPKDKTSYSLELLFQIWNDKTGERLDIGPDRDSLGMIEFRSVDSLGKCTHSLVMTKTEARLAITALQQLTNE